MDCPYETPQPSCFASEYHGDQNMPALAMLYSPWQQWVDVYDAKKGLMYGTIFKELNQPFLEGACPNV